MIPNVKPYNTLVFNQIDQNIVKFPTYFFRGVAVTEKSAA